MKKKINLILLLLILTMVFVGCKNNTEIVNEPEKEIEIDNNNIIRDIYNIRDNKKPKDLVEYLDKNISIIETEELSEGIYILNNMQKKYLEEYSNKIKDIKYQRTISLSVADINEIQINSSEDIDKYFEKIDEELKNILLEAYSGNYKLIRINGIYSFEINYENYNKYIDVLPEIKLLMDIYNEEQRFVNSKEYKFEELSKKLLRLEEYIFNYKDSQDYEKLLRIYSKSLLVYLEGDSRLVLVDENNIYKQEILNEYKLMSEKDTILGEISKDYLEKINISESVLTEEVKDSVLGIHNKAIALLEK